MKASKIFEVEIASDKILKSDIIQISVRKYAVVTTTLKAVYLMNLEYTEDIVIAKKPVIMPE